MRRTRRGRGGAPQTRTAVGGRRQRGSPNCCGLSLTPWPAEIIVVDDAARMTLSTSSSTWNAPTGVVGSPPKLRTAALLAGLERARGDVVGTPISSIRRASALRRLSSGGVRGRMSSTPAFWLGWVFSRAAPVEWGGYSILRVVSGMNLRFGQFPTFADRMVVDALLAIPGVRSFSVDWSRIPPDRDRVRPSTPIRRRGKVHPPATSGW